MNFPKLQRTPFSQNTSGRLLLNESDVAPKQIKSLYRVFRDMIFLLLEDMQEEKVKDIVKLDVHQLIEKGKYRGFSSIYTVWKVKCKVITTIPSPCFALQIHAHVYLLVIPHYYSCPVPCYVQHLLIKRKNERHIFLSIFFGSVL